MLLELFPHKATIVLHKCAVISQSNPTTTKHPASVSNLSLISIPLDTFLSYGASLDFEFVLFCVLEGAWEINHGEFRCGILLMLLSDCDVLNMCGPGSVPDERAGVYLCECVFV